MAKVKLSTAIAFLPLTLLFIGPATPKAKADVIWNYAGNITDTCVYGPCDEPGLLIDSLNLAVTFNGPLADNLNSVDLNALSDIVSWTLTDTQGFIDFSSATAGTQIYDSFTTDASGDIVADTGFTVLGPNWGAADSQAAAVSSCDEFCDEVVVYDQNGTESASQAYFDGVWSSTPEPSTTLPTTMGAGILVLALRRKYRRENQTTR